MSNVLLADVFYRISHDPQTGKPLAHPLAIGVGCATALLCELLSTEHIDIDHGDLKILNTRTRVEEGRTVAYRLPPPADALTHMILDELKGEPDQHPLKDWLRFLARTAASRVATRITRSGEATEYSRRTLLGRRQTLLVPAEPDKWEGARSNLYIQISAQRIPTWDTAWMCGIVLGVGMHHRLLTGAPESAHDYLRWVCTQLPPAVQDLVNAATAATGDAVTTGR